jgi:hypothetical protein
MKALLVRQSGWVACCCCWPLSRVLHLHPITTPTNNGSMASFDGDRAATAMAAARAAGETIVFQSCAHCHEPPAPGSKLQNCKGCLMVCYCSVECQRASWPMHKLVCAERGKHHADFLAECHARGFGAALHGLTGLSRTGTRRFQI